MAGTWTELLSEVWVIDVSDLNSNTSSLSDLYVS